eukprot:9869897-Prorocentrum_lima.AAC.1
MRAVAVAVHCNAMHCNAMQKAVAVAVHCNARQWQWQCMHCNARRAVPESMSASCLLYTSDAADDM